MVGALHLTRGWTESPESWESAGCETVIFPPRRYQTHMSGILPKLHKSAASHNWMELKEKKQLILLLNSIKHYIFFLKMCSKNYDKNPSEFCLCSSIGLLSILICWWLSKRRLQILLSPVCFLVPLFLLSGGILWRNNHLEWLCMPSAPSTRMKTSFSWPSKFHPSFSL